MSFSGLVGAIGFSSFAYMILAMQVHGGFPPFYKKRKKYKFSLLPEIDTNTEKDIKDMVKFIFGILGCVVCFLLSGLYFFLALIPIVTILCGLMIRKKVLTQMKQPQPWVSGIFQYNMPIIGIWIMRWPMLVFDLWTVSFSLFFFLISLIMVL